MATFVVTNPRPSNKALSLSGSWKMLAGSFTFSSSYATGGELLSVPGGLDDKGIYLCHLPAVVGGRLFEFVPATGKVKAYSALGTEVVATTDLSAVVLNPVLVVVR